MRKRKEKRRRERPAEQSAPVAPQPVNFPLTGSELLEWESKPEGEPKGEMHDVIHAPDDDGIAAVPLGPHEGASVSFHPDLEAGDAGADLAEEFGGNYVRSATTGEDVSELENPPETDPSEFVGPFVIEQPPEPERPERRPSPGRSSAGTAPRGSTVRGAAKAKPGRAR